MRAMELRQVGEPLQLAERAVPEAGPGQVLLRVLACGVCRTDLHLVDGEVQIAELPRVLGHQIVGETSAAGSDQALPASLDAAIIFAPDGALVPLALRAVVPGGMVVCGGIHMSDIPSFPYADLWEERTLRSVANLTRADAAEFLA